MKRNEINIRDPFVLLHDGVYYLYGTRGPTCWGPAAGFDVYTGTDLENWSDPIPCFENDGICDNELCYRCGNVESCKKERKQRCF